MRYLRLSAVALVAILSSCSVSRVYIGVVQAHNEYSGGNFQDANRRLVSLQHASAFEPWISYNIGTVYYALGEPLAAADKWQSGLSVSRDLALRQAFNLGVLAYERGDYREAYDWYRQALQIDPSSVEAKINLEYAYEKLEDHEDQAPSRAPSGVPGDPGADIDRLLQYVERLEVNAWQSTDRLEATDEVNDW